MAEMVEKAVNAILKADAPIATVVGTRIHHDHLPQNQTLPALTYGLVDDTRPITHDTQIGPGRARIQVTAHAVDFPTARDLAEKVADLDGTAGTFAAIIVQLMRYETMVTLYSDDPVVKEHFIPVDFFVHYGT